MNESKLCLFFVRSTQSIFLECHRISVISLWVPQWKMLKITIETKEMYSAVSRNELNELSTMKYYAGNLNEY